MVKLVDMPDLGSGAARRVGSSPILGKKSYFLTRKGKPSAWLSVRTRNEAAVEPAANRRVARSPILGKI